MNAAKPTHEVHDAVHAVTLQREKLAALPNTRTSLAGEWRPREVSSGFSPTPNLSHRSKTLHARRAPLKRTWLRNRDPIPSMGTSALRNFAWRERSSKFTCSD